MIQDKDFNPYDISDRTPLSPSATLFSESFQWMGATQRRELALIYDICQFKENDNILYFKSALKGLLGLFRALNIQNQSLTRRIRLIKEEFAQKEKEMQTRERYYENEISKLIGIISNGNNLYTYLDNPLKDSDTVVPHLFED